MVKLAPFRGIRYNTQDISELICPPYDIISEAERKRLSNLSVNNFVNIELPEETPTISKYKNAKNVLNRMLKDRVLVVDEPSIYIYSQEFTIDDKRFNRTGIVSLVKLENPEKGNIFPHEKTLLNARKDRARLLYALKSNTSPVFFISDTNKESRHIIEKIIKTTKPDQTATTSDIQHKLWQIKDKTTIQRIISSYRNKNLYIADGHHRYVVAYHYSLKDNSSASKYVLGFISDASDKNLIILPTHRVSEVPFDTKEALKYFTRINKSEFIKESFNLPQPIQLRFKRKTLYLKLKQKNFMDKVLTSQSFELKNIAPSIAKHLILDDVRPEKILYICSATEAKRIADTENKIAVILPPTPLKAIIKISRRREYMPQKSTYFYPKVFAGLVFYHLPLHN